MTTTILLNGSKKKITSETVAELVPELGFAPETILIELNGEALHRSDWPSSCLVDGDKIELLRVAAGG